MSSILNNQTNILCVGDVLCGKSDFLQNYTHCLPQSLHYKVYPKMHNQQGVVFFHQVEERFGMDAYFTYPFDAILYFLNINEYHNPQYAIIQQLTQISKLNGTNIFKMPVKLIVLSSKTDRFYNIKQLQKQNLKKQLLGMVQQSMIIFVEDDENYIARMTDFYGQIRNGEAKGIEESFYVNWQLKGLEGLIPLQSIIFNFKKMYEMIKKNFKKLNLSMVNGKKLLSPKNL